MIDHEIHVTSKYFYTDDDMENIVVTAIEGGIGYWACLDNTGVDWEEKEKYVPVSVWCWKLLKEGKVLHFLKEDGDDEFYFGMENLHSGIGLAIQEGYWSGDMDDLDGNSADAIFQFGLFDELVYG